jgi:hypothetical protein
MAESKLVKALRARSIAKREKAIMELDLLINNPVAIGEHTTNHLMEEANKALSDLADADSELEMIEMYLSEDSKSSLLNG